MNKFKKSLLIFLALLVLVVLVIITYFSISKYKKENNSYTTNEEEGIKLIREENPNEKFTYKKIGSTDKDISCYRVVFASDTNIIYTYYYNKTTKTLYYEFD